MAEAPNTYHICLSYEDKPIPWSLDEDSQEHAPAYIREALRVMDEQVGRRGLTVYLTWKLNDLPSYGKDVVAVVMGDEWARVPDYAHQVLATFKCYGTRPPLGGNPIRRPSMVNLMLTAKYVRTLAHYAPGAAWYAWHRFKHAAAGQEPVAPIYPIPLGYGNQLDLPIKPIRERPFDLSFAGSIEHSAYPGWSPKRWIRNPKSLSRSRMVESLRNLKARRPELNVALSTVSSFAWNALFYGANVSGDLLDAATYSQRMMDTKICLIPRGTSPETFRYFEAMRYGCILITERLPSRWFYDGSPAIQVDDWGELESIVERLLTEPDIMEQKHREALRWWEEKCSEPVLGTYMADKIKQLLGRSEGETRETAGVVARGR